ncbi:hypothetical protein [Halomonas cerina]|uniref:Uncharacterized protein n=1 Tax=Halomonas cerina TaxID=447424 RepID=A0A839VFK5_9GAMM|nr:hypothetical protein [Halomonas cerina]MBB3191236.1 hypothetical protein [Halomonas cerina]
MKPQDLLKKIGVLGVSLALVAGPLAFAADDPAAKATDSAANPMEGGDLADTLGPDGEVLAEDEVPTRVEATDSAANPVAEGDLADTLGPDGEALSEDEVPERVEATDSAANPVAEGDLADPEE